MGTHTALSSKSFMVLALTFLLLTVTLGVTTDPANTGESGLSPEQDSVSELPFCCYCHRRHLYMSCARKCRCAIIALCACLLNHMGEPRFKSKTHDHWHLHLPPRAPSPALTRLESLPGALTSGTEDALRRSVWAGLPVTSPLSF